MRPMACAAAALMFAFTVACRDRDREDTASRIDTAAEETEAAAREDAEDVENTAEDADNAVEDAVDEVRGYSYERRDEFRRDVRERLVGMDKELAELERTTTAGTDQARRDAVAAARDARQTIDRSLGRLNEATESNWDELKSRVNEAVVSADRQLRALRPDANPMGGTSGPN